MTDLTKSNDYNSNFTIYSNLSTKKKLILSKYLRKFQREKPQELQLGKIRSILQYPKISFEILQCMIIDTINHEMSWEKLGENADRSDKGEKKKIDLTK